jgi:hypothetical protein
MYTSIDFRSKRELREAVAAGRMITVYQPINGRPDLVGNTIRVEGPHYPRAHTWYARVELGADGTISKVV